MDQLETDFATKYVERLHSRLNQLPPDKAKKQEELGQISVGAMYLLEWPELEAEHKGLFDRASEALIKAQDLRTPGERIMNRYIKRMKDLA